MSSDTLDDLRGLIIRDDSGLAPLDITMLGRVAARLEYVEMILRHEESKHRVRDTRKGEWPKAGQSIHEWDQGLWESNIFIGPACMRGELWLPAPPPPEES